MKTCRYCGSSIAWARHQGRWVPLNPSPDRAGRFYRQSGTYRHLLGIRLEHAREHGWNLYAPHTCIRTPLKKERVRS